jgi:predicted MPP superfamily phosphohydrolase
MEFPLAVFNYLLWFLVICNGNAALQTEIINRLHGCRLPNWWNHLSLKLHFSLQIGVPFGVFLATGCYGPRLVLGGRWSELPPGWWIVFGVFSLATLQFWCTAILRHLRPIPRQQLRLESRHYDIAAELGRVPDGAGPYHWLTKLPGNEIFQLDVHEREFLIARLPAALDGLSILHLSDIHFIGTVDISYFRTVVEHVKSLQVDLICFTGDLLDDLELLPWFAETFDDLQAPMGRFFILGNHDWQLITTPIREELTRLGWQDVADSARTIERSGHRIVLKGDEFPWMGENPTFEDCHPEALRILLSHTPDNIRHARQQQVDLMLSGHNHGGQVRFPFIGPVYCPSKFGCYYAEGVFFEDPVLLHVSRGVAGRHSVRYGCPPEITRLVLRSPDVVG